MVSIQRLLLAIFGAFAICAVILLALQIATGIDLALGWLVGAVSLVIAMLSVVPLVFARTGVRQRAGGVVAAGIMLSMAIRFSLAFIFLIFVWNWQLAPRQSVGLWGIFWYYAFLLAEIFVFAQSQCPSRCRRGGIHSVFARFEKS